jgi:acyl-CoA synthetase (NDP forming)
MEAGGVPCFLTPERGADALAALIEHGELNRDGSTMGGGSR